MELKKVKGWFYIVIKSQYKKNIWDLVQDRHCVIIGGIKWKVIGKIRENDPFKNDHVGIHYCDIKYQGKENIIYLPKLTQNIWDADCHGYIRKVILLWSESIIKW